VHIDDVVGIYLHALDGTSGALDATAPEPVRNSDFTVELARALHRPAFFPVPAFAIGLMLGEGALVVTEGQRVLPEQTQASGYRFRFENIAAAFAALFAPAPAG
jgi:NAD dependent epimerase/dehydratase family enzyme